MRKHAKMVWAVMVTLVLAGGAEAATYSGGSGTAEDPYQIGTAADWTTLAATVADWDKHFVLTADIDFAGATLMPVGNGLAEFTGMFDGGGHVLRNGQINLPDYNSVGVFGDMGLGSEIHDLGAENITITGDNFVGGLVGEGSGTITSCYVTGAVTGNHDGIGGLLGYLDGTVTSCYSTGTVAGRRYTGGLVGKNAEGGMVTACYATGAVTGGDFYIGGLVGDNHGPVTSCYATGAVTGNSHVGGLVGFNYGTITACYSTGTAAGASLVGGLLGANNLATVTSSYWDMDASGLSESAGGEGRTTEQMTHPYDSDTYVGWDFVTVWAADSDYSINNGYPYLRDGVSPGEGEMEGEGEPLVSHPADLNADFRIVMGEAIAYLSAWQQGSAPMANAIRAAYLWQRGEYYTYDGTFAPPLCWVLAP